MESTVTNRLLLVTILAGAVPMVSGCGDRPSSGLAASTETAVAEAAEAGEGQAQYAAPFTLDDLDGVPYSLSDSNGKVRLLDFWATWCAPCREEVPMLNELHEAYAEAGLEILAISDFEEGPELVRGFVEKHGIQYKNLIGSEEVTSEYSVWGLPTAYLIDREGRVVETFAGPKPRKILEARIREALELPPA